MANCIILQLYKNSVDQYESDLTMVVHSLILSMTESSRIGKPETCNASCIRSYLVKLLQSCGYNADMCATKWQGCGKIPGGILSSEFNSCLFAILRSLTMKII